MLVWYMVYIVTGSVLVSLDGLVIYLAFWTSKTRAVRKKIHDTDVVRDGLTNQPTNHLFIIFFF